ncbi:MAG: DUF4973 domain-containing protein [Prevotella sp.]|jgi:hypothetical protein|nr:DUF4973 domain-containing protein [Prevotella sp.]
MKKLYFSIIILGALLFISSCNDEWKDELYTNMLSLKAPINRDDVSVIYLRYQDKETNYKLPVIVSGSQINNRDYTVNIKVDNDTLKDLNRDKYNDREDLFYRQLSPSHYEFPSQTCQIPAGSDVALFDINFKLKGLDLVEKWVLPLTIAPDPSYTLNTYKGRQKALLWVIPFNDYSGSYSATNMKVYFGNNTEKYMAASTREARVVDENTIFFYAGITEELAENRGLFKVKCEFIQEKDTIIGATDIVDPITGDTVKLKMKTGKLKLSADNEKLALEVIGNPTYVIREESDIDRPFIVRRTYILTMEYRYEDRESSSNPDVVFPYRCTGTMSLQRDMNVIIPDEDQAILW